MNIFEKIAADLKSDFKAVEDDPANAAAIRQFNQGVANLGTAVNALADAGVARALAFVPLGLGDDAIPLSDAVIKAMIAKLDTYLTVTVPAAPAPAPAPGGAVA